MEIHRAGVVAHERRRCLEVRRQPGTLLRWSPWRTVALWKVYSGLDESKRPICERLAAVLEQHTFHNYGLFIRTENWCMPRSCQVTDRVYRKCHAIRSTPTPCSCGRRGPMPARPYLSAAGRVSLPGGSLRKGSSGSGSQGREATRWYLERNSG